MNTNEIKLQSGERVSFYELFIIKGYKIEIPIIQRDYAQGRNTTLEVRELFLDALFDYLHENMPFRDLDFVYGTLINNTFIPLDGQQRLTTLFLLHWYLSNLSGNFELFKQVMSLNGKSRFTYETRTSSSEFCNSLINNSVNLENLLPSDDDRDNSLSKTIQNYGWYYLSWKYDPTIQSMLTMLDAIHSKFKNNPEFFNRLINPEEPIITFLFLNLNDFKLTDDLYIKMNSRGKPLSSFENFKAKFEQHISSFGLVSGRTFKLKFGNTVKNATLKEYFSFRIDTVWADLFWNYRTLVNNLNDNNRDQNFDDELMNFIRVIFSNQFAVDCTNEKDEKFENLFGTQVGRDIKGYSDVFSYHRYMNLNVLSESGILYLIDALDQLTNGNEKIKILLQDTFYYDENKVFENVLIHDNLTLIQRVQFHAYVRYLIINKKESRGLHQWMRFIHNLAKNTVIDGAADVVKAIKSIEKLLPFSTDILNYLITNNKIDFFNNRQIQEEIVKAILILKDSLYWKDTIETIEKHPYFEGQIGFILEFSGILDFFEKNNNCSWTIEQDHEYYDSFLNYCNKSAIVFNSLDKGFNKDYCWERSVLTKGNYLIQASSMRRNFLSTSRNFRDFSWKRLLRLPPLGNDVKDSIKWEKRRMYVKAVFDDPQFDCINLTYSLEQICKNSLVSDWRSYFIANPELIRYCGQGFIRFESASNILLFHASQQNHMHREMYSYNLFSQQMGNISDFSPFKKAYHYEIRSSEDNSCAVLENWKYKDTTYAIDAYFNSLIEQFELKFYNINYFKEKDDFPPEVVAILESKKFEWNNVKSAFWLFEIKEYLVFELLKDLCSQLNNL